MSETKCAKCGGGGIVQRGLVVKACDCEAGKAIAKGGPDEASSADTRRLSTEETRQRRGS